MTLNVVNIGDLSRSFNFAGKLAGENMSTIASLCWYQDAHSQAMEGFLGCWRRALLLTSFRVERGVHEKTDHGIGEEVWLWVLGFIEENHVFMVLEEDDLIFLLHYATARRGICL